MKVRSALSALEPVGVQTIREALEFGRRQGLGGSWLGKVRGYRLARSYGLDLLPPVDLASGLVIDAGANQGGFTAAVLAIEPRANVLAIEPAPEVGRKLRARFEGDGRVRIDSHALSDQAGTAVLHETGRSEFASLLRPHETVKELYEDAVAVVRETEVPTARLDDLVDEPVSLLKIDVQGNEKALLGGAQRTLQRTSVILLEVMFVRHYQGDALFTELHELMEREGFVLGALTRPQSDGRRAVWADACYVRA